MSKASSGSELLQALEKVILRNRGALYEGDVFSILQGSPYIIRSFEFAPADGCIDCAREFDPTTSFADRLWESQQADPSTGGASELVLFDVKSKVSEVAGDQVYLASRQQHSLMAFFIGICAADTTFVEVLPNFSQGRQFDEDSADHSAVNTSRQSKLDPSTYRLDPSNSPYRMPAYMLQEAIYRVRRCAQGYGDYVNPWTMVRFEGWRPSTVSSLAYCMPAEGTEHLSACKAALEIQRIVKTQSQSLDVAVDLDFIGLQPRLADFKLVLRERTTPVVRQVFIQHKLDVKDRSRAKPFTNVAIARSRGEDVNYWFDPFERFDFLFYQFTNISTGRNNPRIVDLFFLPEYEIPDEFYTTKDIEASFEKSAFWKYRMNMDKNGEWLKRVIQIVLDNPMPRRKTRPQRPQDLGFHHDQRQQNLIGQDIVNTHSRALYRNITTHGNRQFFRNIMTQCATRASGMLIVLSNEHPVCDFAFCRFHWTSEEQLEYFRSGLPPKTVSDLPGMKAVLPICYYTRDLECTFYGPEVSSANFRRLNSCQYKRLVVWNLFGPDDLHDPSSLIVIPSEDIRPTESQRSTLIKNLNKNKKKLHSDRTPDVSSLLSTGLYASEYAVGASGPLAYTESAWDEVWKLLNQFTSPQTIDHPTGKPRHTESYMQPLWKLHQRLMQEDNRDIAAATSLKRKRALSL